ncbi:hypothetical protein D910_03522 [Dendroctonus ponderosae]|uniref:Uncharacterized protein n=1 Tax=Dendroctonus ponderosae TaxID=77166 RepID=U4U1C1_DENPD|nr:hypothetical protein D910_03522 [Dendroctonus ponderosae]
MSIAQHVAGGFVVALVALGLIHDLSGGNSNDSSGGPAPGTPNSQGMRPTPSPTGSTGSRSMSPAVGKHK